MKGLGIILLTLVILILSYESDTNRAKQNELKVTVNIFKVRIDELEEKVSKIDRSLSTVFE